MALVLRLLLLLACLMSGTTAVPQQATATVDEVKAAFLQKFPGYVTWPPSALPDPTSPLVIAVFGSDGVFAELERVAAGSSMQGRPIVVRRLPNVKVTEPVHILFVGNVEQSLARALVSSVHGKPVLLVTDRAEGLPSGSILNFRVEDGRVRFDASVAAAEQAGLKLSSRLLGVAAVVVGAVR